MTTGTLNSTSTTTGVGMGTPQYLGFAATDKVGFYGVVPVVQRPYSSAVHATSAASSSTDFGATQLAIVQEIMKTLIGLGIWATV
jgi:hypothetical protein